MILMEQAAKAVAAMHTPSLLTDGSKAGGWIRRFQSERPMGTVGVVVGGVDPEHLLQLSSPGDQQPVQALRADRTDPALGVGVGPRRQLHPMAQVSSELSG